MRLQIKKQIHSRKAQIAGNSATCRLRAAVNCDPNLIARKQDDENRNIFCRMLKKKIRGLVYGPCVTKRSGFMSYVNLFKPSATENDCDRIIARRLLHIEKSVEVIEGVSKLCALRVEES